MPRASQRLGEKKSGKWGVDSAARGGSGGEAFFHLDPKEKLSWWWLSNRYENCFSLFLVRDHSKRLLHSRRRNYIRRLGGAGKRGQGPPTTMSVRETFECGKKHFSLEWRKKIRREKIDRIFFTRRWRSRNLLLSVSPFFKNIFRLPAPNRVTPTQPCVCRQCHTEGRLFNRGATSRVHFTPQRNLIHTHTIETADLSVASVATHTHTQEKIKRFYFGHKEDMCENDLNISNAFTGWAVRSLGARFLLLTPDARDFRRRVRRFRASPCVWSISTWNSIKITPLPPTQDPS